MAHLTNAQRKAIFAQTPTQQKELSEFLVKEMLKRKVPPETIIGGLRKAGVPNPVIKQAFDKNIELVKRGLA